MKKLLISIRSNWVYHILKGDKTIELRKMIPKWVHEAVKKGETVECLVYCTKAMPYLCKFYENYELVRGCTYEELVDDNSRPLNGRVIAQFDLRTIDKTYYDPYMVESGDYMIETPSGWSLPVGHHEYGFEERSKVSYEQYKKYSNYGEKDVYFLTIDNLKILDKPKELSEYHTNGKVVTKAPQNMMTVWERE